MAKRIYSFDVGLSEGRGEVADLLGEKGANLALMSSASLPVPPGFTITTETCGEYNDAGQELPAGLMEEVRANLAKVEKATGKRFGDPRNPLLVAARSGAKMSMPGMMDTVLNIGLNDEVVLGLAALTGNERFAYDSYRRLINMFGDTVMGVDHEHFEHELSAVKQARGVQLDTDLSTEGLKDVVERYKKVYRDHVGSDFPQDPFVQVEKAIEAVFKSWMGDRAIRYRELNDIRGLRGTAVNVQSMVFGNMGEDSATGVAFTRNPSTGENKFYGEFLINAQGEDVVAGIRTPIPIDNLGGLMPTTRAEMLAAKSALEGAFRWVLDLSFTIERGRFFVLSARRFTGRLAATAAVRIAVEMVVEGILDEKEAVQSVASEKVRQLLRPVPDPGAPRDVICRGLPAVPGVGVGKVVVGSKEAVRRAHSGEKVVLVLKVAVAKDSEGIEAAEAIIEREGGMTSHAAVGARRLGRPAVTGANGIELEAGIKSIRVGGRIFGPDDWITVDGTAGEVLAGRIPLLDATAVEPLKTFLRWEEAYRPRKGPAPAYTGSEPYAFVSYSHQDKDEVYAELARLSQGGFRHWYDEGIQPSTAWAGEIVKALDGSRVVVVFLSPHSVQSPHVRREANLAMDSGKPCIPIYLTECELPDDLKYYLAGTQMLFKHKMPADRYREQLEGKLCDFNIGGLLPRGGLRP